MPCCNQHFEEVSTIAAPPALVHAILTDVERYPEWNTVIPAVRIKDKEMKEGAATRIDLATSRGRLSIKASLSLPRDTDPDTKTFGWTARFPIPGMFKTVFSFVMHPAADGGGTRLVRSETYTGLTVPVFGYVIRDTDKRLDEMVLELKARAEAIARGPPPAAPGAAAPDAAAPDAAAPEAATPSS